MVQKKLLISTLLFGGVFMASSHANADTNIKMLKEPSKHVIVAKVNKQKTIEDLGLTSYKGVIEKQNEVFREKQEKIKIEKQKAEEAKKRAELEKQKAAEAQREREAELEKQKAEEARKAAEAQKAEDAKKQAELEKQKSEETSNEIPQAPKPQAQTELPPTGDAVKDIVRQMMNERGWGNQWEALNFIVDHESSWNPLAQNPSSTAHGLFQMLTETSNDPAVQAQRGLDYIAGRYGDPNGAYAFWTSHNWY